MTPLAGALALAAVASASNGGIAPVPPVSPNGQRHHRRVLADPRRHRRGLPHRRGNAARLRHPLPAARAAARRRGPSRSTARRESRSPGRSPRSCSSRWSWRSSSTSCPGSRTRPRRAPPSDALNVTVEAHQFYWLFKYPNGTLAVDQHARRPGEQGRQPRARSESTSRTAGGCPAFGGKTDAIPGKTNHTWFKAEKVGTYAIKCAEFCGLQHAVMNGVVKVVPQRRVDTPSQRLRRQAGASRACAPRATGCRARASSARRSRRSPTLAGSEGAPRRSLRARRRGRCRPSADLEPEAQIERADRLPQDALREAPSGG